MNESIWKSLPFIKAFADITSKANKVDQKHYQASGDYPIIDQGQDFIAAYIDDKSLVWGEDLPVIIFGDHTRILKYIDFPFVLGADGTKVLKPCDSLWPKYTYYALQNIDIPSAGYSRHYKYLKEETISFPELPEQKRIVEILDKADRLRRLRRYAQELSDTFLQSVLLEMFGDPLENPKSWDFITLDDVIYSVKDGPHVSPEYTQSGIPFLSTRNIRRGEVFWEDLKYISLDDANRQWKREGSKPEIGDILYTKGGTTGYAKVVDFEQQVAVWVHIAVLKPRHEIVNSTWLENMLNTDYCYQQSQELTFGIVNRDLGLRRMIKIKLYLPPLNHQEEFVQIVQHFNNIRIQQCESFRQSEILFQSLLHQAFQGEL